ncbi:MAG: hypothetical protein JWM85_440 [Acidimicrobiaceae bacterium]|nr:hypothetical protein [Acidimicrobiaceae bacterium]
MGKLDDAIGRGLDADLVPEVRRLARAAITAALMHALDGDEEPSKTTAAAFDSACARWGAVPVLRCATREQLAVLNTALVFAAERLGIDARELYQAALLAYAEDAQ